MENWRKRRLCWRWGVDVSEREKKEHSRPMEKGWGRWGDIIINWKGDGGRSGRIFADLGMI